MVVEPLDPAVLSDADWSACYALHSQAHAERGTEPNRSAAAYRKDHQRARQDAEQLFWIAREGDRIIGKADLFFRGEHRERGGFGLYVLEAYRRKGAARELLRPLLDAALARGCQSLDVGVDHDDSRALCAAAAGVLQQTVTLRALALDTVDRGLLARWIDAGRAASPGARIELFECVPVQDEEAFMDLWRTVELDVPRPAGLAIPSVTLAQRRAEEAHVERVGGQWLTVICREPDGSFSGMTDVRYDGAVPKILRTELTGVRPSARGRGVARWLKAEMVALLPGRFPRAERLLTTNADDNDPMVAINRQLGFTDVVHHSIYRFETSRLAAKLQ